MQESRGRRILKLARNYLTSGWGLAWFLARLVRKHPQLLVIPLRRVLHAATDSPPQSH
jgi:hypothetical protein